MPIPEIEKSPKEKIYATQNALLQVTLKYISTHSPFYAGIFKKSAIDVEAIKTIEDLQKLPVTTKDDLQQYNFDFLCVDKSKIVDYVSTSGTLGEPVIFGLTEKDLQRLAYNEALSLECADGNASDLYQLTTTIDKRFMAGMAYFLGARKMGAGIIRVGPGIPELQWDNILKLKPNALISVPSFLLVLIKYAEKNNIDLRNTSVERVVCIGEPIRNPDFSLNILGKKIVDRWPLKLYSTYASTEMIAAFTECAYGLGGHHHPELIITEFLDEDNQAVKEGEPGELTITTLGVEGMPLLRFKTGDICVHYTEPCLCGRTTIRLGPILGRKKQMIKFKGTTLYPPALYEVLDNIEGVKSYLVEVFLNELGTDEILIRIAVNAVFENFEKEIKDRFRAKLRVSPTVVFEPFEVLKKEIFPENSRKPIRFIDKRI